MNTAVHDHMLSVAFTALKDPVERVRFYRANKDALGREEARAREGRALPSVPRIVNSAATVPMGLTIRRGGKIIRHIPSPCVTEPHGGLFGPASRK